MTPPRHAVSRPSTSRRWLSGEPDARAATARTVDDALRTDGFLLVPGHGVDSGPRDRIREAARAFFVLPTDVKQACAAKVGGRGRPRAGGGGQRVFGGDGDLGTAGSA